MIGLLGARRSKTSVILRLQAERESPRCDRPFLPACRHAAQAWDPPGRRRRADRWIYSAFSRKRHDVIHRSPQAVMLRRCAFQHASANCFDMAAVRANDASTVVWQSYWLNDAPHNARERIRDAVNFSLLQRWQSKSRGARNHCCPQTRHSQIGSARFQALAPGIVSGASRRGSVRLARFAHDRRSWTPPTDRFISPSRSPRPCPSCAPKSPIRYHTTTGSRPACRRAPWSGPCGRSRRPDCG